MLLAQVGTTLYLANQTLDRTLSYHCPVCQTKVILKLGTKMIPHFAHQTKATCPASEGETYEHLAGKLLLQTFFQQFTLEVYLPDLKQRPDLLWEDQVIEFQCSPLSHKRFLERTHNYLLHGYQPIWILGQGLHPTKRLSQLQQACLRFDPKYGFFLYGLDVACKQFLIFRYLHWSYEQGLAYQLNQINLIRKKERASIITHQTRLVTYQVWIQQQLAFKRRDLVLLQQKCYAYGSHLAYLESWMYNASEFGILFSHRLLYYRLLFRMSDSFLAFRQKMMDELALWPYPFLDRENIVHALFDECVQLAKKTFP